MSECSSTDPASSSEESRDATPCGSSNTTTFRDFDPTRVRTLHQLEAFDLLVHPVWVFDFNGRRNRWANEAALKLWNSPSLDEFLGRRPEMSATALARTQETQNRIDQGRIVEEQWTFYPKIEDSVETKPVTVHMTITGVRLSEEETSTCFLVYARPLVKDELLKESLRGVEMLRHLPMAVCQFDLKGKVMFQNQAARLNLNCAEGCGDGEGKDKNNNTTTSDDDDRENPNEGTGDAGEREKPPLTELKTTSSHDDSDTNAHSLSSMRRGDFCQRFVNKRLAKEALEALETQEHYTCEAELHTAQGNKWSFITLRKTKDPVTSEPVILYSAQDKSDAMAAKKEREARLQKSEFLAIMAHEIRTPLHQVTGFIDLLDQTQLNTEQKSFVKLLKSSAKGLMTVISDVLDYSKLEAGKMKLECIPYEPFGVVEGSMEAVRASCEEKGIDLSLKWNRDIPFRLMGDPNRLRQILLNLLSNATRFTPQNGTICVEAVPVPQTCDNPLCPNMIKFVVTDSGMGIRPEHQEIIFRKYQQADVSVARNFGGTGLGLSICQQLTQNMGGSIGVESEWGKGASFWFCLQAVCPEEQKELAEPDPNQKAEDVGSLQVLVVEDNKINQKLMANMLKRMGHKCDLAWNGMEAIDMIKQKEFDLILMDIQMPVMDGLEATRRLRTMGYTNLPILGLTASVARSDFTDLGFNDWLPKPIPMKDLKAKLSRFKQCQLLPLTA